MDEIKIPMSRPSIDFETQNSMFDVIKSGWISQGKKTQEFESDLSEYLSSKVVVVNNGTSALTAALLVHGVKPGDKVIVPSFTFIATSSAAKMLGANILVADIDSETLNVTPDSIEKIVKEHDDIKAVIVVDMAGQPLDLEPIIELSKRYNFILIEDAAQAIGSEYKNKKIGSFEHTSCFSFTVAKIITTVEGGCITTQDEQIHKKLNQIRNVGRDGPGQYVHHLISSNYRFTDIQAALGINQLKQINQFLSQRIKISNEYKNKIKTLTFQKTPQYVTTHSHMLFFAFAKNKNERDRNLKFLRDNGIDARLPYMPIHKQPCNFELESSDAPNSNLIYETAFTLPIFNNMTEDECNLVVDYCNKL